MYKSPTRHNRAAAAAARRWRALGVAVLAVLAAQAAFAQDETLPIQVESNNADLSHDSGKSTYTGDVVLKRGGLTLTGDRLVVTRINDRRNVRAQLTGAPARLDKQPDRDGDDIVTGHADEIEYVNNSATVILRGDAMVERGGDRVSGQVIRHNIDTERTQAERGGNGQGRVRITIQPKSDSASP